MSRSNDWIYQNNIKVTSGGDYADYKKILLFQDGISFGGGKKIPWDEVEEVKFNQYTDLRHPIPIDLLLKNGEKISFGCWSKNWFYNPNMRGPTLNLYSKLRVALDKKKNHEQISKAVLSETSSKFLRKNAITFLFIDLLLIIGLILVVIVFSKLLKR